jgi:hypothetical protein
MSTPECLLFMCMSVGNVAQHLTEWGEHDMDDIFYQVVLQIYRPI